MVSPPGTTEAAKSVSIAGLNFASREHFINFIRENGPVADAMETQLRGGAPYRTEAELNGTQPLAYFAERGMVGKAKDVLKENVGEDGMSILEGMAIAVGVGALAYGGYKLYEYVQDRMELNGGSFFGNDNVYGLAGGAHGLD